MEKRSCWPTVISLLGAWIHVYELARKFVYYCYVYINFKAYAGITLNEIFNHMNSQREVVRRKDCKKETKEYQILDMHISMSGNSPIANI